MFSKPMHGWSKVYIGDQLIGCASYIQDVPTDTLEMLIKYIKGELSHFELRFDGEGYDFGICEIMGELYAFSDEEENMKIVRDLYSDYNSMSLMHTVRHLAKEIHDDFTRDFEAWVMFFSDSDEEESAKRHRIEFKKLLNELHELLEQPYHDMELGNLVFGNSRGKFCVPRDEWEDTFKKFLNLCGFDDYGHIDDDELERIYGNTEYASSDNKQFVSHIHMFKNNTFELRPYYWGDSEFLSNKPNFVYKPNNVEICWYKYPLRDAYANKLLTFDYFCRILRFCAKSLDKQLDI